MWKTLVIFGSFLGAICLLQGCEAESDHGPAPYYQGQPPSTSKNTAFLYGSATLGEQAPGPGLSVGGDFVDVGSPDAE